MSETKKKSVLVIIRHTPYGSSLSRAALDTALAMAAFEQSVDVLFMGDGVLQLLHAQDSETLGLRNIRKLLGSLPLYDIESVYVDQASADRFNLDLSLAPLPLQTLDGPGINALMGSRDHLLGF